MAEHSLLLTSIDASSSAGLVKPPKAQKVYFDNLDLLRVVAFGMVFLAHSELGKTLGHFSSNSFYIRVINLLSDGGSGVSFFFVLSGYLITYLLLQEREATGRIHLSNFYVRRTLRIWPLYFAVLLFGFFVYPAFKGVIGITTDIAHRAPFYFTFLSNFDSIYLAHNHLQALSVAMIGITWSVAIEEQFYLVWPLLFLVVPKRYYQAIFYGVILCSLVFRYLHRTDGDTLYFHTLSVMSDLAMGGLFAYHCRFNPRFVGFFQNLPKLVIGLAYLLGFALLLYRDDLYPGTSAAVVARLVSTLFFAFIITEQNFAGHSPSKLSRLTTLSRLGKYTYGLYLLHPIAIQVTILLFRGAHLSRESVGGGFSYAGIALAISLIMSYISYRYFEAYFLRLKHKFS
ncbi:acyltransferase family protein [Hymenobacter sp. BT491]|uniref:acyltransferase family protein n=1 Tax=Hymenobacter sp. BT491 TaxID=2766779 RepID=UPI001653B2BC|nr:acyltransferase [Hymenobacter sp. BT491]MBC6989616.1 acyltransferase [Hymenobacter sp. BT491]